MCPVFNQILPMEKHFTCDAAFKTQVILCAEKIGNRAGGRKYTVREAKLFPCLTNRKSFSGPNKGRSPETDALFWSISKIYKIKDYL
jgi:hypothetical protein